ncbi:MAG: inner membrane-spanning protein YciB [Steroidobacteraceae bacterium]
MQALFDLVPVAAFFVAYSLGGIYVATAVLMAGMALLLLVDVVRLRRIPPMHALSAALVLVLGGATLVLRDVRFLKWKPTVFLWLMAGVAAVSAWFHGTPLAQRLLQPMIARSEALPRALWLRLNWIWVAFYALLGALNLWIAYYRSERAWVNFKFFGLTLAFALFAMAQAAWLASRPEVQEAQAS